MDYIRELDIDPFEVIEIGQKILVRPPKFGEKSFYYSNIQDITDDLILISVPSSESGRPIGLRMGDLLEVALTKDKKRYGFFSQVMGRRLEPFFMLEIRKPGKIYIAELREYFRVPVYIPYRAKIVVETYKEGKLEYTFPKELTLDKIFFKGHIHDISGGGVFITADKKLEVGTLFLMSFSLKEEEFRDIPCKVVRRHILDRAKEKEGYGAKFHNIDEKVREKIIKFCFARQRELRREGKL